MRVVDDLARACPRAARSSTSAGSASFTNLPAYGGTDARSKRAASLTGLTHGQALALADLAVDLAERGREVHDARAVVDA